MGKRVDIPGVGIVDFPDTMTEADINTAIQNDILKTPSTEGLPTAQAAPAEPSSIPRRVTDHLIQFGGKGSLNLMK